MLILLLCIMERVRKCFIDFTNQTCVFLIPTQFSRMYTHIYNKMTRWWLHIPLVYWLVGAKKTEDYYLKALDDLTTDIVKRRRKDLECCGVTNEEGLGIVDRYILSGELSNQEIKWETFSLFTTVSTFFGFWSKHSLFVFENTFF